MGNPITVTITSATKDSPMAGQITLVGTYDTLETYPAPAQRTTVGNFPTPVFSRAIQLTGDALFCIRNGANNVIALAIPGLAKLWVALDTTLSPSPYFALQPVNTTCVGTPATGTLTGSGSSNVADGDTVTIGTTTYRFKSTMAQVNDIQIAGSGNSDTSLTNLIDAINGTGTAGTNWYAGTVANTQVSAGSLSAHAFTVTAIIGGLAGNSIGTTKSSSIVSWGGSTLSGGSDAAANFTVTVTSELSVTYLWQYSSDQVTWHTATGTVSGTTYTNGTTATLTCTPTTQGQNGVFHRCLATNTQGTTTSGSAVLTIP